MLIAAYAALMLYFVALVTFGGPSFASRILLTIFWTCFFITLAPWLAIRGGNKKRSFRRLLLTYRLRKTERIELIVGVILWTLIGAGILFLTRAGN